MECDLGNLVYFSQNVLPNNTTITSSNLITLARDDIQELANKLWELPTEKVDGIVVAKLPDPVIRLPREKPCPKPKMDTKWDRFSKLKGITNKKRGRLNWNDELKQWIPRWGFKSENNQKDWFLEVPKSADPYEDQFAKKTKEKKERVAKNELQRLRNISRNSKGKVTGVGMMPTSKKETRVDIKSRIAIAKHSTASMGNFDTKVRGENKVRVQKKRQFESNFRDSKQEKDKNLALFAKVRTNRELVNKDRAARNEQVSQEANRVAKRKADEDDDGGHKNKKAKTPKKQRGTSKHSKQKRK